MKTITKTAATLICLCLLLTFAFAKKPKAIFEKNTDFSRYKSYAWASGTAAPDVIVNQVIIQGIEYQLENAGLTKRDAQNADLLVRYDAAGGVQGGSTATDPTYAASGGMAPITASSVWTTGGSMDVVMKGSLSVRLLDKAQQRVVWTSVAEEGLDDRRARRVDQVSKIVREMFKDFPIGRKR